MSNASKRKQICGMSFIPITSAGVVNMPGDKYIRVSGDFVKVPISSGEFTEEHTDGSPVKQTLSATVTDTGIDMAALLENLFYREGLLLIRTTDGAKKVIGTDEFPVLVTLSQSGSPAVYQLSFDRESPEPAKYFQSF